MKKIIIILSMIFVLFLVGCDLNENLNDNNMNKNEETQQQIEESVVKNEQVEIEKYKLSDEYELNGFSYDGYFNVGISSYLNGENKISFELEDPFEFESNGKKYNIITKKSDTSDYGLKLFFNGEAFDFANEIYAVGVIDLDPTDDEKEIAIRRRAGDILIGTDVYKINEEGKLEEYIVNQFGSGVLCSLNDKYFFPVHLFGGLDMLSFGPVVGYYMYENGELVYVDRLLTGEKAIDENGKFVLNDIYEFSNDIGLIISKDEKFLEPIYTEESSIIENGEFKVLSFNLTNTKNGLGDSSVELSYVIELLDDAEWTIYERTEVDGDYSYNRVVSDVVEKGTAVEGVTISISEP